MELRLASLLANLELIRATHPELRSSCIFLQTWLELLAKGRVPPDLLPSRAWREEMLSVKNLATVKLFEELPVEQRQAPGFALFEEDARYWLTDGVHSIRLGQVAGFHPCLSVVTTQAAGHDRVHYLIEGSYWNGQPLPQGLSDLRKVVLVIVQEEGKASYVQPMIRSNIQILREAERVAV